MGLIEHVNLSVTDPHRTAAMLQQLCGWKIRWEGPAMNDGYTVHVGSETNYLALYTNQDVRKHYAVGMPYGHIGLQVDDLDLAADTVRRLGIEPYHFQEYDPGRRFYFLDADGIEFEVVSYE